VAQHQATLEQVATPYPEEWKGWLEWFATLPLFLDLGQLRAVHAAWDPEAVKAFQSIKRVDGETLRAMADQETRLGRFRNHLLNGVELTLPEGCFFTDKAGFKRKDIRTRWWEPLAGKTYSQVVFPRSDTVPDILIPTELAGENLTYGKDEPPVFIGHYWLPADAPKRPMALNVACLDYSVAKGGELVAYSWDNDDRDVYDGKRILTEESFRSKSIFDRWEMYEKAIEAMTAERENPLTTAERKSEIYEDLWSIGRQRLEAFFDLEELAEYYRSQRV